MNLLCHFCVGHLTLSTAKVESNVRVLEKKGFLIVEKIPFTPPIGLAQTTWRPAENVGNHDQVRPGTARRNTNLRPPTMEKGLGESL